MVSAQRASHDDIARRGPRGTLRGLALESFEGLIGALACLVLRALGWAGRESLGVFLLALALSVVCIHPRVQRRLGAPDRHDTLRTFVHIAGITVAIYAIGWGALLGATYVVALLKQLGLGSPARIWRHVLLWSLVGIAIGETVVALGWVHSYLPRTQGHGLAAASATVAAFVMRQVGVTARARELAELQRKAAVDELRGSERRFRALALNSTDVVTVADTHGRITYVSPSVVQIMGYQPEDMIGRNGFALIHPDDIPHTQEKMAALLTSPEQEQRNRIRVRHADGEWHWHDLTSRNFLDDAAIAGLVMNHRDVSDREQLLEQMRHQATHDALTGLPNRTALSEHLGECVVERRRSGQGVLFIDVDDFKLVNDSFGHATGDELLVQVAQRLARCIRPQDFLARLGGDEFAIVATDENAAATVPTMAQRIVDSFADAFVIDGRALMVRASVGLVVRQDPNMGIDQLLAKADFAMYSAKARGKGRVEVFDAEMHRAASDEAALRTELALAADAGQLRLDYQPIVDLRSGAVVGAEALVRWDHPTRGLLPPGAFIGLAEESGSIDEVGAWVLQTAALQVNEWRARDPQLTGLWVSVNLSVFQLRKPSSLERLLAILTDARVTPGSVVLEVTETGLLTDVPGGTNALLELKSAGALVALDDFGTGMSSLSTLSELPIDILKLDRWFLVGATRGGAAKALLEAVVGIADKLDLDVIAEGIEGQAELDLIRTLGCGLGQGYALAPPDSAERLVELLPRAIGPLQHRAASGLNGRLRALSLFEEHSHTRPLAQKNSVGW